MTKPLALVFYERLLPGNQLMNRLQDMGYRVVAVTDSAQLASIARQEKPMFVFVDLQTEKGDPLPAVKDIRANLETKHIPILGFTGSYDKTPPQAAISAGINFVALDDSLLPQLPHLLEQMLSVE